MSKNLDELLNYDGLHEAEKLTGNSYKEDDSTSALGLLLSIQNNGVMVGHIDGREGFAYFLENARKNGKFLAKWVERPFLWLLTYDEPKVEGYDYNAINAARFAQFPQHVQDAMGA